ncbi:MAG: N-acetylmuramoyl-L-alanine amidase [Clostridia bacterium]|nr:N-acetylmuramoyl-L-alanine amidase [Clostridia bacterium]
MKKTFLAGLALALASFFTAVGMCIQLLNGVVVATTAVSGGKLRVVLDAGHGGIDGGVVGRTTGIKESDLNLSITHFLKDALADMGFDVVLTRKTEAGLYDTATKGFKKRDMQRRKEVIEKARPDLVVSIHQNFYASKNVRGGQVFYGKRNEKSKALALAVQERLNGLYAEFGVKERSAKTGEYYVLECTEYPSVIVECGFLSNPDDEELLADKRWQKRLVGAIATGVIGYFDGISV